MANARGMLDGRLRERVLPTRGGDGMRAGNEPAGGGGALQVLELD
jgi:hypothetical protein